MISGDDDTAVFARDGFCGPFDLQYPDLADAALAAALQELSFKPAAADLAPRHILGQHKTDPLVLPNAHLQSGAIMKVARDPAILRRLEQIAGPEVHLRRSQFWRKPAGSRGIIWHQDIHRKMGLGDIGEISAWIALEDATLENGCVWLLRGSHRGGMLPPEQAVTPSFSIRFFASDTIVVPEVLKHHEPVPMVLRKGQFFLFHQLCFHASGPNRTEGYRTGLAFRYLTDTQIDSVTETLTQVLPEPV